MDYFEYLKNLNKEKIKKCSRCGTENPLTIYTMYGELCAHCNGDLILVYKK